MRYLNSSYLLIKQLCPIYKYEAVSHFHGSISKRHGIYGYDPKGGASTKWIDALSSDLYYGEALQNDSSSVPFHAEDKNDDFHKGSVLVYAPSYANDLDVKKSGVKPWLSYQTDEHPAGFDIQLVPIASIIGISDKSLSAIKLLMKNSRRIDQDEEKNNHSVE